MTYESLNPLQKKAVFDKLFVDLEGLQSGTHGFWNILLMSNWYGARVSIFSIGNTKGIFPGMKVHNFRQAMTTSWNSYLRAKRDNHRTMQPTKEGKDVVMEKVQ
jgi:hypothetical protein